MIHGRKNYIKIKMLEGLFLDSCTFSKQTWQTTLCSKSVSYRELGRGCSLGSLPQKQLEKVGWVTG